MTPEQEVNALCRELRIDAELKITDDSVEVLDNISKILAVLLETEARRREYAGLIWRTHKEPSTGTSYR